MNKNVHFLPEKTISNNDKKIYDMQFITENILSTSDISGAINYYTLNENTSPKLIKNIQLYNPEDENSIFSIDTISDKTISGSSKGDITILKNEKKIKTFNINTNNKEKNSISKCIFLNENLYSFGDTSGKIIIKDIRTDKTIKSYMEQSEEITDIVHTELKDNFIYVLKRILSNKDEYSYNRMNNFNYNYSASRNKSKNSRNASYSMRDESYDKYKTNYSIVDPFNKNRIKYDINNSYDNLSIGGESIEDNEKNDIKEAKAKKYLNALYRNNFGTTTDGIPYSKFINKNISLYEELFTKPALKDFINTETFSNYESPQRTNDNNSLSRRTKSTGLRKKIRLEELEKNLIRQYGNKDFFHQKIKNNYHQNNENHSVTERRNHSTEKKPRNHYKPKIRNTAIQSYKFKRNIKFSGNNESNKKNKNNVTYIKRSPYLLNKF